MTIEIAGHTDAIGTEAYNLDLSKRRATSVMDYLVEKGKIDKARITIVFFGEDKPIGSNETKEGRKKNRRVEFKIIKL
jgi:outer membrane protein OmpA-like peptidoglycan-associated protein